MAIGVQGVKQIANSPTWQQDLEISPAQVEKLKAMFADQSLMERMPGLDGYMAIHASMGCDSDCVRQADEIYRPVFSKILEPEQINQRRLRYLKSRFAYPLDVFYSDLLRQIGLPSDLYEKLEPEWRANMSNTLDQVDEVRRKQIEKLLELSPSSKDRFVEGFSAALLPKSMSTDRKVSLNSMGILDADQATLMLNSAIILVLPEPNTVSTAQRAELTTVSREMLKRAAKDNAFNPAKMAFDGLERVLSESQRTKLVEINHLYLLRSDLNLLASKRVLDYLQVKDEVAEEFIKICEAGQQEVQATRMKKEKECLALIIGSLPKEPRQTVDDLLAGVWVDAN